MWVFDEKIEDENLTDIINTRHQNVKYLPNIDLPHNLVADPDLLHSIKGADILVFNILIIFTKHSQTIVRPLAPHVRAISCLKGFELGSKGVQLLSSHVTDELGIQMWRTIWANLAPEVAKEHWSENHRGLPTTKGLSR
nr:BFH_HP1_G0048480.mRNA.1.CDS.1 [Saccharomyces cerevisiae]